ncbi:DoxX family protein [Streptomyces sp. Li-HN-5-11]|uniref:DoxX family protein n=1 Tax=Streptomyces sp. Li-HN-5-11 TaxID=3075432 RepID=UPI0028A94A3D|nr:DoxX family protein [Streptomyces sp. Li-HN-5-11]WNM35842.1 DoxX family protein [Streptomyces sp. Li-HN-5-11]
MNFSLAEALRGIRPAVLTVFRLLTGFLFACHGAASLFGVLGGAHGGGTVPMLQWPGWWAAVIELVGGTLVALGLFTRTAALICSGSMAYAYFSVHQSHALFPIDNGGEPAVMFCWAFLLIACLGPGSYALGRLLKGGQKPTAAEDVAPVPTS